MKGPKEKTFARSIGTVKAGISTYLQPQRTSELDGLPGPGSALTAARLNGLAALADRHNAEAAEAAQQVEYSRIRRKIDRIKRELRANYYRAQLTSRTPLTYPSAQYSPYGPENGAQELFARTPMKQASSSSSKTRSKAKRDVKAVVDESAKGDSGRISTFLYA